MKVSAGPIVCLAKGAIVAYRASSDAASYHTYGVHIHRRDHESLLSCHGDGDVHTYLGSSNTRSSGSAEPTRLLFNNGHLRHTAGDFSFVTAMLRGSGFDEPHLGWACVHLRAPWTLFVKYISVMSETQSSSQSATRLSPRYIFTTQWYLASMLTTFLMFSYCFLALAWSHPATQRSNVPNGTPQCRVPWSKTSQPAIQPGLSRIRLAFCMKG